MTNKFAIESLLMAREMFLHAVARTGIITKDKVRQVGPFFLRECTPVGIFAAYGDLNLLCFTIGIGVYYDLASTTGIFKSIA